MYQQLRLEPYAVHTTFQYSGTEGKHHRMREAMAFYDPPEYYDPPGILSLNLDNTNIDVTLSHLNFKIDIASSEIK